MTACLHSVWIVSQIGFASSRNLMSSFGKASQPFCTDFVWASSWYFSNFSKNGTWFSYFSDYKPKKIGFRAWGRFCMFFMSNILPICLPYGKCSTNYLWSSTKVDRTYLPVNMALALFHKHLKKSRNIFERGIGKTVFFLIELPIGIAYWPLLFPCGRTAAVIVYWIADWIAYWIAYCIAHWIAYWIAYWTAYWPSHHVHAVP